VELLIVEYR